MSNLYLRKVGLVVVQGQQALDLSQMKITFHVNAPDFSTPKNATIRVWNLSDNTAKQIQKEFQSVNLQAGYQDANFGTVFQGTIKLVRRGRENAKDSFVDIIAADSDLAHTFGFVNTTLAAGSSPADAANAIHKQAFAPNGVTQGNVAPLTQGNGTAGGVVLSSRSKAMFGMAGDHMSNIADSSGCTWSIQDGVLQFTPYTGFQPGEAVVLNAQTGLIGVPEATDGGIIVRCLLNPLLKAGGRIQINNADINQTQIIGNGSVRYGDFPLIADTSVDGFYRILVVEHVGDTRGQDWYSEIIALNLDSSAVPNRSVSLTGVGA